MEFYFKHACTGILSIVDRGAWYISENTLVDNDNGKQAAASV